MVHIVDPQTEDVLPGPGDGGHLLDAGIGQAAPIPAADLGVQLLEQLGRAPTDQILHAGNGVAQLLQGEHPLSIKAQSPHHLPALVTKGQQTQDVYKRQIKTRVPLSNLRLLDEKAQPKVLVNSRRVDTKKVRSVRERDPHSELDLRGMTVEEALLEVDQFIDNAVLTGLPSVTLIHGKGTGALRKAVQEHLRHHPNVRTYRLGTFGEGESGVTIAELK